MILADKIADPPPFLSQNLFLFCVDLSFGVMFPNAYSPKTYIPTKVMISYTASEVDLIGWTFIFLKVPPSWSVNHDSPISNACLSTYLLRQFILINSLLFLSSESVVPILRPPLPKPFVLELERKTLAIRFKLAWFISYHPSLPWRFLGSCRKTCFRIYSLVGISRPGKNVRKHSLTIPLTCDHRLSLLDLRVVSRKILRLVTFNYT